MSAARQVVSREFAARFFGAAHGSETNVCEPAPALKSNLREDATTYLIAGILGFIAYSFFVDSDWNGVNGSFWYVMCRLFAKHIKLAFKLAFWFIVAGALIFGCLATAAEGSSNIHIGGGPPSPTGGGPESEKFYRTMNKATAPLRWVVDGLVSVLGALSLVALVLIFGDDPSNCVDCGTSFLDRGILGEYRAHLLVGNLILFALYLLWIWVTVSDVVRDEYRGRSGKEYTLLSLVAIGAWAVAVLAAAWGIRWLFAGMWS